MIVSVEQKKEFVQWLNDNVSFSRREVYWILNYLLNHTTILNQVVFVEHAKKTPRGIKLSASKDNQSAMELFLNQRVFTDPDQIFHELRMNWKKELYMEVVFESPWNNELYLSVLQDNPFYTWNDRVDSEFDINLEQALLKEKEIYQVKALYASIDEALETGDQEAFKELTARLNKHLSHQTN